MRLTESSWHDLLRPSKEAKPEKEAERGKNRDAWKTNSKSQARGAICLLSEVKTKEQTTNTQQNRTKRQRLLLELKGHGQFARARETRGKRQTHRKERTNKQTKQKTTKEGERKREK